MSDEPFIELSPEDFEDLYFETGLSRELDRFLAYAKSHEGDAPFMPVSGLTGGGKTSIIKSWLSHNHLKNWYIEGYRKAKEVEAEYYPDLSSGPSVQLVSGDRLNDLLTPKKTTVSVLFSEEEIDAVDEQTVIVIDDYDRFREKERQALFDLIAYRRVVDLRSKNPDKTVALHPLLMIVVLDAGNFAILNSEEKRLFGITE